MSEMKTLDCWYDVEIADPLDEETFYEASVHVRGYLDTACFEHAEEGEMEAGEVEWKGYGPTAPLRDKLEATARNIAEGMVQLSDYKTAKEIREERLIDAPED